jgi:hypothetical protein
MAKATKKSSDGTSFHDSVIFTTPGKLKALFPNSFTSSNDGRDKCNYDFVLQTEDGDVFTIYDWKEYRKLKDTETIEFHIGGAGRTITEKARRELEFMLKS